jgi:hypothetical protein
VRPCFTRWELDHQTEGMSPRGSCCRPAAWSWCGRSTGWLWLVLATREVQRLLDTLMSIMPVLESCGAWDGGVKPERKVCERKDPKVNPNTKRVRGPPSLLVLVHPVPMGKDYPGSPRGGFCFSIVMVLLLSQPKITPMEKSAHPKQPGPNITTSIKRPLLSILFILDSEA